MDKNSKPFIKGSVQQMRDQFNSGSVNAVNDSNEVAQPEPRYKNLEELRSEFGSYRVNNKTNNISEPDATPAKYMVKNDPYRNQADNK